MDELSRARSVMFRGFLFTEKEVYAKSNRGMTYFLRVLCGVTYSTRSRCNSPAARQLDQERTKRKIVSSSVRRACQPHAWSPAEIFRGNPKRRLLAVSRQLHVCSPVPRCKRSSTWSTLVSEEGLKEAKAADTMMTGSVDGRETEGNRENRVDIADAYLPSSSAECLARARSTMVSSFLFILPSLLKSQPRSMASWNSSRSCAS